MHALAVPVATSDGVIVSFPKARAPAALTTHYGAMADAYRRGNSDACATLEL